MHKIQLILSMVIFGTIGLFVRYIPLSSSLIAFIRALIGFIFIYIYTLITKIPISFSQIKKNGLLLLLSGLFMGFNWILLFESYKYTSIACATICYYMAPIFVLVLSPIVLQEKMTAKQFVTVLIALTGMLFVSGVLETGVDVTHEIMGIGYGLIAALFYASVVLMNKKMQGLTAMERTLSQLGVASLVLLPYVLLTESISLHLEPFVIVMLIIVGMIHTGLAYTFYFSSLDKLETQTVAIYSYMDPVVAIVLSCVFLKEALSLFEIIGASLILGATFFNEFLENGKIRKTEE